MNSRAWSHTQKTEGPLELLPPPFQPTPLKVNRREDVPGASPQLPCRPPPACAALRFPLAQVPVTPTWLYVVRVLVFA